MKLISICGACLAALFLCQPVMAADSLEIATAEFEACVLENLAAERAEDNPDAEQLIQRCDQTYQALVAKLPQGAEANIVRFVKQQIEEMLAK
jgi:hypothetical protein